MKRMWLLICGGSDEACCPSTKNRTSRVSLHLLLAMRLIEEIRGICLKPPGPWGTDRHSCLP
ncbi:hypothetical protein ANANG_G00277250, partial [Anguilla anguilla]